EHSKRRSIRLVLHTLMLLRRNCREEIKRYGIKKLKTTYEHWMEIPYIEASKAALKAECYFTALMYLEAHCHQNGISSLPNEFCYEQEAPEYQKLLLDIYRNIDEPDGIYGVNRNYGIRSQILKYEHEGDWEKCLGSYNILVQTYDSNSLTTERLKDQSGILKSLRNLGFEHSLQVHLDGGISDTQLVQSKEFREVYYECAWRGLRWNINEIIDPESNVSDVFNRDIYKCLKALVQGDASQFWDTFERS